MHARIGAPVEEAIAKCQAYAAYANDNYMPFLWKFYKGSRATLFSLLDHVNLVSTSQDNNVFHSLEFLRSHRKSNAEWLDISSGSPDGSPLVISWISDKWWKLVTGCANRRCSPERVNRRQFEVCVFSQIMNELKAGRPMH